MTDEQPVEEQQPSLDEIIASYSGDDFELRSMIEKRGAVLELMRHPGWIILRDFIQSEINKRSERIVMGTLKSHEEYLRETGWCKGAYSAFTAIDRLDSLVAARVTKSAGYSSLADFGMDADMGDDYDLDHPASE